MKTENNKVDVYAEVTNKVIKALETGDLKAVRSPWVNANLPTNLSTRKRYSGFVNNLLMIDAREASGFRYPLWVTFLQVRTMGARVKEGAKATCIYFAKTDRKTVEKENGEKQQKSYRFLKRYFVFNLDQLEGVDADAIAREVLGLRDTSANPLSEAMAWVDRIPAKVTFGGDSACFRVSEDCIQLPVLSQFKSDAAALAVRIHELIHWTGHPSRLNREDFVSKFGSEAYAAEELVAELGSMMLCAQLGIPADIEHESYIASWLTILKNDKRAIFKAATLAEKAIAYLTALATEQQAAA